MGRITSQQKAALDILDWLYFNQILVFSVYSENDQKWLKRIIDRVSDSVGKTGEKGLKAEYLKHCVLCFLEIFLADDIEKFRTVVDINDELSDGLDADTLHRLNKYKRDFFSAYVFSVGKLAHDESITLALEIAIVLQEQLYDAPALVRYRLAERCLAYEFKEAPLDFFTWLAELQVIRCAKYQSKKLTIQLPEQVITRIGLLCEFEILRRCIGMDFQVPDMAEIMLKGETGKLSQSMTNQLRKDNHQFENLADALLFRKTFSIFDINRRLDSAYVADFFTQVHHYFHRIRLWQGTQASWLGTLGGFIVEIKKSCNYTDKLIYVDANNKGTITDDVSIFLSERGFSITGRTLYENHRRFVKEIKSKVLSYYTMLGVTEVAPPPENDDMYYYNIVTLQDRVNG